MTWRAGACKFIYMSARTTIDRSSRDREASEAFEDIISVFCSTTDSDDMKALFDDLFTSSEIGDMITRWLLMADLYKGRPQREIAESRNLSLCKITRGSRMLKKEGGFMRRLLSSRYDDHTHI